MTHERKPSKWGNNPDTWMVILTAVFIAVGGVTAVIFYGQFKQMSKQTGLLNHEDKQAVVDSEKTARRAEEQVAAARRQAAAAQQSADATRTQMRESQRAWLGTGNATYTIDLRDLKVGITIGNVGKSPALDVSTNIAWKSEAVGTNLRLRDIVYPRKDLKEGTVFPGQHFVLTNHLATVPPSHQRPYINKLKNGEDVLYVFAKIRYRDIFGIPHWTHYCGVVNRDLKTGHPCNIYNDSDSTEKTGR